MDNLYLTVDNAPLLQLVYCSYQADACRPRPKPIPEPVLSLESLVPAPLSIMCPDCPGHSLQSGSGNRGDIENGFHHQFVVPELSIAEYMERIVEDPSQIRNMIQRPTKTCADAILFYCCTNEILSDERGEICLASGLPAAFSATILAAATKGAFLDQSNDELLLFVDMVVDVKCPAATEKLQKYLLEIYRCRANKNTADPRREH
uniref:Uncharacterized protein n=1 Tax=Spongospora subterranea TaxID=70186 RepID=A0A0H5R5I0_9EUKA|eukprot:CRZ09420.1 hypothetical protein [Spongospora subterranea]